MKLNSKKWKNYSFTKKKSLVGLTPGFTQSYKIIRALMFLVHSVTILMLSTLTEILTAKTGTDKNLVAPIVLGEEAFLTVTVELL